MSHNNTMLSEIEGDASGISDPGSLGEISTRGVDPSNATSGKTLDNQQLDKHLDELASDSNDGEPNGTSKNGSLDGMGDLNNINLDDSIELESTRASIDQNIIADYEDGNESVEVLSQTPQNKDRKVALQGQGAVSKGKKISKKNMQRQRKRQAEAIARAKAKADAKKGGGDKGEKGEGERGSEGKGKGKRNLSHTGITPDAKRGNVEDVEMEQTPDGGEPIPKKASVMTWAEVSRKSLPTFRIVSEDTMCDLDQDDYNHICQSLTMLLLDMMTEDTTPEMPIRNGLQDGMILVAMSSVEAMDQIKGLVPKIAPRIPGGSGYRFLEPGKLPYRLFLARTVHSGAATDFSKFEAACKMFTPGLRKGLFRVVRRVFPKTLEEGKPTGTVGLLLKIGEGLLPLLEECRYRLPMMLTSVRLEAWKQGSLRNEDGTHEEMGGEGENMDHE